MRDPDSGDFGQAKWFIGHTAHYLYLKTFNFVYILIQVLSVQDSIVASLVLVVSLHMPMTQ